MSRIAKYSKCLAEEEERWTLQHTGTMGLGGRKQCVDIHQVQSAEHLPSTQQRPGPSLFSVFAAGVQHPRSSNRASLTAQVRKFLLLQCHPCHPLPTNNQTAHIPQVIDNLCIFRYSGELTVLMRTKVRYLDVWDLRPEIFPIIILRVTRTNGTYVHLIIMNYMFPMCERQTFYPNLMRRWRNSALNLRMTYRIAQSNKIGDSGHRPSHASIMPLVFEGYPRILYSHRLSELRNSNKRHQTSSFYVWALTSV